MSNLTGLEVFQALNSTGWWYNIETTEGTISDTVRQEGERDLEAWYVDQGTIEVYYINRSWRQFFEIISEIKIIFKTKNGFNCIFRLSNRRRAGSCSSCIRRKICKIPGIERLLERNLRVLECPYLAGRELYGDDSGIDSSEYDKAVLLFSQLVTKIIKSNPFI